MDGHIVKFYRDVVAGDITPTVTINPDCCRLEDHPVVSPSIDTTKVAKMRPTDDSIDKSPAVEEQTSISLSFIAPLTFVHPLLIAPYQPWPPHTPF